MKKTREALRLLFVLLLVTIPASSLYAQWDTERQGDEENVIVGRLSHIEGPVSRYMPDEDQWLPAEEDGPFGPDDILQSGRDGRAELIVPNNTWIRINNDTQIHIVSLHAGLTDVAVDEGVVRFYNKGPDAVIRASTPFGSVSASSRSSFDLYVDDTSLEVVALKGRVSFVHTSDQQEFEVIAGSSSLLADRHQVTAGRGIFDRDWEAWNNRRDNVWRMRAQETGESRDYLPPPLSDEGYVLDSYGRWVRVYYDGAYRTFWRPVHISIGWAPFTVGTWMMWHGDYCWLPGEPFGYVTHHYGNWVLVNNLWYWAPPVTGVRVRFGSPFLHVGFAWYPGRVGWVRSGLSIGWAPLAPYEPYYAHHRWGPHVIVVQHMNARTFIVRKARYRYARHTVTVPRKTRHGILRKEKIRAVSKRRRREGPSNRLVRKGPRKKLESRRVIDVRRHRNLRRTVLAKRHEPHSKARSGRRRHGDLKVLPRNHTRYAKRPSALKTTDQAIKKRAVRGKKEKKRRQKVKQSLRKPRFRSKPLKENEGRREVRKQQPRRITAGSGRRSIVKTRGSGSGKRSSWVRFAQRDYQPRSPSKAYFRRR